MVKILEGVLVSGGLLPTPARDRPSKRKEYLCGVWFQGGHACCAGKLTLGLNVVLQFSLLVQFHGLQRSFQQLDGNGDAELDSYLAMPGNTSTGDLWYRNRNARRPWCQGACALAAR